MELNLTAARVLRIRRALIEAELRAPGKDPLVLEAFKALGAPDYGVRLAQGMSEAGRRAAHDARLELLALGDPERLRAPWPDFSGEPVHEGDTIEHPDGSRGVVIRMSGRFLNEGERWKVRYYDDRKLSSLGLQINGKGQAVVVKP